MKKVVPISTERVTYTYGSYCGGTSPRHIGKQNKGRPTRISYLLRVSSFVELFSLSRKDDTEHDQEMRAYSSKVGTAWPGNPLLPLDPVARSENKKMRTMRKEGKVFDRRRRSLPFLKDQPHKTCDQTAIETTQNVGSMVHWGHVLASGFPMNQQISHTCIPTDVSGLVINRTSTCLDYTSDEKKSIRRRESCPSFPLGISPAANGNEKKR